MKRLLGWTLGLALGAGVALVVLGGATYAQVFSGPTAQLVSDVSVTVDLVSVGSVSIVNKGANPIWGQAYYVGQTPAAATITSPMKLDAGEGVDVGTGSKFEEARIRYVVLICGAGLTSTAKVTGKQ